MTKHCINFTHKEIGFQRFFLTLAAMVLFMGLAWSASSAEWSCKVIDKKPPTNLDASIQAILSPQAIQVSKGKTLIYEIWLRTDTPLKAKPKSTVESLNSLKETTLIGATQVFKEERDYREDELYTDLYTMRFSLQPQDGDHLGTSEHPYFAVLTPAKLDKKINGLNTYDELVETSGQDSATGHPFILSLWPVEKNEPGNPKMTQPAQDHEGVRVMLPGTASDEKSSLIFDIIVHGVSEH
jgi:hypothetical protein